MSHDLWKATSIMHQEPWNSSVDGIREQKASHTDGTGRGVNVRDEDELAVLEANDCNKLVVREKLELGCLLLREGLGGASGPGVLGKDHLESMVRNARWE